MANAGARYHTDPDFKARVLARNKRRYEADKADPIAYAERLRKHRERMRVRAKTPAYKEKRREIETKRRAAINANPERLARVKAVRRAYQDRILASQDGYKKRLLDRARGRAIERGIPFELTLGNVQWPVRCPILGVELIYGGQRGSGIRDNGASLDRIDPNGGYTVGNTQVLSVKANRMKNDATLDELIALGAWARRWKYVFG